MPYKDPEKRREMEKIRRKNPHRILYLKNWRAQYGKDYWASWYLANKERRKGYVKLWLKKIWRKSRNYVRYSAIHNWLRKEKGNPKSCIDCGKIGSYYIRHYKNGESRVWNIQWSHNYGSYSRDLRDYVGRCISCHVKHDFELRA